MLDLFSKERSLNHNSLVKSLKTSSTTTVKKKQNDEKGMKSTIEDFEYLLEIGNAEASTSIPMAAGQLKKGE
jgi:hypothetical protein